MNFDQSCVPLAASAMTCSAPTIAIMNDFGSRSGSSRGATRRALRQGAAGDQIVRWAKRRRVSTNFHVQHNRRTVLHRFSQCLAVCGDSRFLEPDAAQWLGPHREMCARSGIGTDHGRTQTAPSVSDSSPRRADIQNAQPAKTAGGLFQIAVDSSGDFEWWIVSRRQGLRASAAA